MLADKRYEAIVALTNESGFIRTRELAQKMDVSETTIRRDVEELDAQKRLIRVHGGAKSLSKGQITTPQDEQKMHDRLMKQRQQKEDIARRAVQMVQDGDCVFLDGGTTILPMIAGLKDKKIKIVTHSQLLAEVFSNGRAELFLLPGDYDPKYSMTTGSATEKMLEQFHFNYAFLSCLGLNIEKGEIYTAEMSTASVKRKAMEKSVNKVMLADSSKFDVQGFYTMAKMDEMDLIITDKGLRASEEDIPENFVLV